jgi:hypothetical protein
MRQPKFIEEPEVEGWGSINTHFRAPVWMSTLTVRAEAGGRTGYLQFSSEGDTPDEARARLEWAVVETLAQGGQLEERRRGPGRRGYDGRPEWDRAVSSFDRRPAPPPADQ